MSVCQGTDSMGDLCQQNSYGDELCYFHTKVKNGLLKDYQATGQTVPLLSRPRSHVVGKVQGGRAA